MPTSHGKNSPSAEQYQQLKENRLNFDSNSSLSNNICRRGRPCVCPNTSNWLWKFL